MKIQRKALSAHRFDGNIQALRVFAAAELPNRSLTIEMANQDLGREAVVVGGTAWLHSNQTRVLAVGDYVVVMRSRLELYSAKEFDESYEVIAP